MRAELPAARRQVARLEELGRLVARPRRVPLQLHGRASQRPQGRPGTGSGRPDAALRPRRQAVAVRAQLRPRGLYRVGAR